MLTFWRALDTQHVNIQTLVMELSQNVVYIVFNYE